MRRRRFDLGTILVVGMGLALLPSFFASEIAIGGWTIRTDRLLTAYCVLAMSVLCVAGSLEARRRFLAARRRRQYWLAAFLALMWGAVLLVCCGVICGLVFFWIRT